jgi:hypothetical protein
MMGSTSGRFRASSVVGCVLSAIAALFLTQGPAGAFPDTPHPRLRLNHVMTTSPFAGSSVSMIDNEGSAYIARDGSLWMSDDNGRALYEVDPVSGALKRTIGQALLTAVRQLGGSTTAGTYRVRDLESIAYDANNDILYAFSGKCCTSSVLPTAFRLLRDSSGTFQLDSYQPLPSTGDFTGAAWNPGDGKLYVGVGADLRTYDYVTNTMGATFQIQHLSRITGMSFSADGADLFVSHSLTKVSRVSWATMALVDGWSFDLSSYGVLDARAVEIIDDRLWVSDGYDFRGGGDPLSHATFVFDVTPSTPEDNLVGNAGFEQDLEGWNNKGTAGGPLEQVSGGHSGSSAARLTNTTSSALTITLNDAPNWIATTGAGTYTARAWVRSDTGTQKAYLKVVEYHKNGTKVGETSSFVLLSPTWQQVTVTLTPQAAGLSTLDLTAYVSGAAAGTNLYVDDVAINFAS